MQQHESYHGDSAVEPRESSGTNCLQSTEEARQCQVRAHKHDTHPHFGPTLNYHLLQILAPRFALTVGMQRSIDPLPQDLKTPSHEQDPQSQQVKSYFCSMICTYICQSADLNHHASTPLIRGGVRHVLCITSCPFLRPFPFTPSSVHLQAHFKHLLTTSSYHKPLIICRGHLIIPESSESLS